MSVTVHRDNLICAGCSSVTAAKELFLFNADRWSDEERAAWGCSPLSLKRHSMLATVAGEVTMLTAWRVLIMMYLFIEALSLAVSEMSVPAAAEIYSPLRHWAFTIATWKKQLEEILVMLKSVFKPQELQFPLHWLRLSFVTAGDAPYSAFPVPDNTNWSDSVLNRAQ